MMTDSLNAPLQDPEGYIMLAFLTAQESVSAVNALENAGISGSSVQTFRGPYAADSVETESRWFADTHEDLRRFHDVLAEGGSVVTVKESDSITAAQVMNAIAALKPLLAFHFGDLVTKSL